MGLVDDIIETPYGDVWLVRSRDGGELVPMYSDAACERASIEAYLAGNYGALTSEEVEFFRGVAEAENSWFNPSVAVLNQPRNTRKARKGNSWLFFAAKNAKNSKRSGS